MNKDSEARILADIIWSDWTQKYNIKPKITWIEVYQLARYFYSETKDRDIDPQEIDIRVFLDPMLSYHENKKIVTDLVAIKPSAKEEEIKGEAESIEYLQQEIKRLTGNGEEYRVITEEDLDKFVAQESKNIKLREQVKKLKASWKRQGDERAELEKELKKLQEEVQQKPAIKIEILTNFREGIQYFKKGDVIESHNVEWAIQKIEQGLARRVAAIPVKPVEEKPKEVKPPVAPESERERATFLKRKYRAILESYDVPSSHMYNNFLIELEQVIMNQPRDQQEKQVELIAMEAVRDYQAKRARAVSERLKPEVITPTEEEGIFIPLPKLPKPIPGKTADLWIWLLANYGSLLQVREPWRPDYVYGMPRELKSELKSRFYALSKEEQEKLLAQFHSYFPEVTGSLQEWLEKRKDIKYEDYVNMSNEEKADLFDEYIRFR